MKVIAQVIVLIAIWGLYAVVCAETCSRKWAHLAEATEWGPLQGCMVKTHLGRWIPESAVIDPDALKTNTQGEVK